VPKTTVIAALLVNPTSPSVDIQSRELQAAAIALGVQLPVLRASSERDIDAAFETLVQMRAGALLIGAGNLFTSRSEQLAALTLRHAVPAIYGFRQFPAAGGLMSYGGSATDAYRLAGNYVGRILMSEKPADLPILQPTKFDLVINLTAAKAIGVTVPPSLLARADEVIE
jgi:putative ABC transport system substrate-binding protein